MIRPLTDFADVFAQLRPLLARHAASLVVTCDEPGDLQIQTSRVGPSGTALTFGALRTGPSHVSFQLMPVCSHPQLLAEISEPLRERLQGKGSFNFTPETLSPELVDELSALVDAGLARYRADGLA
jgi:hypothetical protein